MSPPLGNSEIWDPIKSTAEKFPLRQCGNGRATWIARICFGLQNIARVGQWAMRRGFNILLCMSGKMPRRYDVGANSFGPSIATDRFVKPTANPGANINAAASLRSVNYMVNHICEPIQSRRATSSGSDRTLQDGDRAPLTFQFAQRFFGNGFVQFRAPVQQIPSRAK